MAVLLSSRGLVVSLLAVAPLSRRDAVLTAGLAVQLVASDREKDRGAFRTASDVVPRLGQEVDKPVFKLLRLAFRAHDDRPGLVRALTRRHHDQRHLRKREGGVAFMPIEL
jgi:hypothetical protein